MMIDEKKLIEKLKEEISETYHEDCILALERAIEIVKEQPKVREWIPADQPPTDIDKYGFSEYVYIKVKGDDGEIYHKIGWYYEPSKTWDTDSIEISEVIAWMPTPKDEVTE